MSTPVSTQTSSATDTNTQPEITYPIVTVDNSTEGVTVTTSTNEDGSATTVTDSGDDNVLVVETDADGKTVKSTQYPVTTTATSDDGTVTTTVSYYDGRSESTANKPDGTITYTSVAADGSETVNTVQANSTFTSEMQAFATSANALVLKAIEDANKSFTKILDQAHDFGDGRKMEMDLNKVRPFMNNDMFTAIKKSIDPNALTKTTETDSSSSTTFNTHEMMRLMQQILKDVADELKNTKELNIEAAKNQQQNDIEEHLDNILDQIKQMEKPRRRKTSLVP